MSLVVACLRLQAEGVSDLDESYPSIW